MNPGPIIIIDSREQAPFVFDNLPSKSGTLYSGDYSIEGHENDFAVERKTIPDLVSSLSQGRPRFERELLRLRGYRFARLLIVGDRQNVVEHNYRSRMYPKAVLHSLAAFEARYVPVVWIC
jgi:DNA excision repair protein ERCC-4